MERLGHRKHSPLTTRLVQLILDEGMVRETLVEWSRRDENARESALAHHVDEAVMRRSPI